MTVGFCYGWWDGLTVGHRFFLKKAKEQCSWLLVGMCAYPYDYTAPLESRMRELYNSGLAHAIIPFSCEPHSMIRVIRPNVLILGEGQSDEGVGYAEALIRIPRLQGIGECSASN